ncbi:MAG: hypothetical protein IPP48_07855 [Chitinophagaceae bacterium]|nr:hypothetical protein [Chitinophagaceae bacterium]
MKILISDNDTLCRAGILNTVIVDFPIEYKVEEASTIEEAIEKIKKNKL